MALMLSTGTVNDNTLASGASVPTTNAGPVSVVSVPVPVELDTTEPPLPQPAISNAAAANETNANGNDLIGVLESITVTPLSALVLLRIPCCANARQANSLASPPEISPGPRAARELARSPPGDLNEGNRQVPLGAFAQI
jgi:hypothetical protein